jgi:hypothetical protein
VRTSHSTSDQTKAGEDERRDGERGESEPGVERGSKIEHSSDEASMAAFTMGTETNLATLCELVQALPRELYDEIYNLTFTANGGEIHVDKNYKPPAQLHVNRASRELFAKQYYGNTTFHFADPGTKVAGKWLGALQWRTTRVLLGIRSIQIQGQRGKVNSSCNSLCHAGCQWCYGLIGTVAIIRMLEDHVVPLRGGALLLRCGITSQLRQL